MKSWMVLVLASLVVACGDKQDAADGDGADDSGDGGPGGVGGVDIFCAAKSAQVCSLTHTAAPSPGDVAPIVSTQTVEGTGLMKYCTAV